MIIFRNPALLVEIRSHQRSSKNRIQVVVDGDWTGLDEGLWAEILEYLDLSSLGRAESVSPLFQSAVQHIWQTKAKDALRFWVGPERTVLPGKGSLPENANPARAAGFSSNKSVVKAFEQARKHGESEASVIRDHFLDRDPDLEGWSRLPRLHTSVLLEKYVGKYVFLVQIALVRRPLPVTDGHSWNPSSQVSSDARASEDDKRLDGKVNVLFEGFLPGIPVRIPNSRYIHMKWNIREVYEQELQKRWPALRTFLHRTSSLPSGALDMNIATVEDETASSIFQSVFVEGRYTPEVTITAMSISTGRPRLVFATGGIRQEEGGIVLVDRLAEQHSTQTQQFGVVPRLAVTLRPSSNGRSLESLELQFQSSQRSTLHSFG